MFKNNNECSPLPFFAFPTHHRSLLCSSGSRLLEEPCGRKQASIPTNLARVTFDDRTMHLRRKDGWESTFRGEHWMCALAYHIERQPIYPVSNDVYIL